MRCYTIGHSNRTLNEFLNLLKTNHIKYVVDIRSYPKSRHSHYKKEQLEETLLSQGISYIHLPGVGGFQRLPYDQYMQTEEFSHHYDVLYKMIKEYDGHIALMCAEKKPRDCHRWHLSTRLEEDGVHVTHIVEPGQTELFGF